MTVIRMIPQNACNGLVTTQIMQVRARSRIRCRRDCYTRLPTSSAGSKPLHLMSGRRSDQAESYVSAERQLLGGTDLSLGGRAPLGSSADQRGLSRSG